MVCKHFYVHFFFGSGRAGREGPGKCFRLYPEREFEKLDGSTKPEIKRCNLSNVILQLKALGIDDIVGFDFIDKPSRYFLSCVIFLILIVAKTFGDSLTHG